VAEREKGTAKKAKSYVVFLISSALCSLCLCVNIFLFCPVVTLPPLELLNVVKEFSHRGTEAQREERIQGHKKRAGTGKGDCQEEKFHRLPHFFRSVLSVPLCEYLAFLCNCFIAAS
jgi:hypothetical protein